MAKYRDHDGSVIDSFKGLWARGDPDTVPMDHFAECENIKFISSTAFRTRDGIEPSQDVDVPLENVKRIYNYNNQETNGQLVLTYDEDEDEGNIYHVLDDTTLFGPILTIEGMRDFAFQPYAGRAYISPFATLPPVLSPPKSSVGLAISAGAGVNDGTHQYAVTFVTASGETSASPISSITTAAPNNQVDITGIPTGNPNVVTQRRLYRTVAAGTQLKLLVTIADNVTTTFQDNTADGSLGANIPTSNTATIDGTPIEKGLQGEFVYVYAGNGTAARKAAGTPLTGNMTIANGAAGNTDPGVHIFGFVNETISGFLSAPGLLETFTTNANFSVSFGSIPTSGDPNVVARHLVASKVITNYNGNLEGYQLFFVPNATINNNTDTFLNNISFFDQDLLEDASHLLDNYEEIPAGAVLSIYHERLIVAATFDDINLVLCSAAGEPESISQIDGIIGVQPDGNPITNAQELRDVLYIFKRIRTIAYSDNGDVPSTWLPTIIDNALGTCVHGIATVLDSGSASIDYLIICNYQGVSLFDGKFVAPELSWKVENYWKSLDREQFGKIQIVNAPIQKEIYIVLPTKVLFVGNYTEGMNSKSMIWCPWTCLPGFNTVAIVNIDEIVFGADIPE